MSYEYRKEPLTFICVNCGKCITFYGEESKILHEIKELWSKRLKLRNDRYTAGIMAMITREANCCESPDMIYHKEN